MLSDANADVIALTDAIGRVVAQYGYTPYGDLLAAERFVPGSDSLATESHAAAIGSRLGHQGLRTERFDRPWDGPLDIGSAVPIGTEATGPYRSLCHNRNRLYDPAEGRFTGNDPNGLGLPVLSGMAFGGVAIHAFDMAPDLQSHFSGGMNAHAAYACAPQTRRDPTGLSYRIDVGLTLGQLANDLVSQYSLNLSYDSDWAGDWGQSDEGHTRNSNQWVSQLVNEHVERAVNEQAWSLLGPVAMLRDLALFAEEAADYYINDGGSREQDYAEDNEGVGYASAAFRSPMRSLLRHGGRLHQRLIGRLIGKGRGFGAGWFHVRVNRQLINPHTGHTLSRMRPDYFAYVPPRRIILGEAAVSQSRKAAERKLRDMGRMYRRQGFEVVELPVEHP